MRRIASLVSAAALGPLALPALALAKPAVSVRARAVPIRGFRHTGNILGAGAAVEARITISGNEYAGGPSPLREVRFYLPKGSQIRPRGFSTCSVAKLRRSGPPGCRRAAAGPVGHASGEVSLGSSRVHENTTVQAFFTHSGPTFFIEGRSPTKIEAVARAHWNHAAGRYGPELVTEVPLIETLPGAPAASTLSINVRVGTARRARGRARYYGTMPRRCPRGGFPVLAVLKFESGETVWATSKAPCPRRARRARHARHRGRAHHSRHHRRARR